FSAELPGGFCSARTCGALWVNLAQRLERDARQVRVFRGERGAERGDGPRVADESERACGFAPHVAGRPLVRESFDERGHAVAAPYLSERNRCGASNELVLLGPGAADAVEKAGGRKSSRQRAGECCDRACVAYLAERDGSRAANGRLLVRLDRRDQPFDARAAARQAERVCCLSSCELVAVFEERKDESGGFIAVEREYGVGGGRADDGREVFERGRGGARAFGPPHSAEPRHGVAPLFNLC